MNSIFNTIKNFDYRNNYYQNILKNDDSPNEYILSKQCENDIDKLFSGVIFFDPPTLTKIPKGDGRFRKVYHFDSNTTSLLKLIAHAISEKYDYIFSNNLYSYRKNYNTKKAWNKIIKTEGIDDLYCYKVDVSSYDQAIDSKILKTTIHKHIDDVELVNLLFLILDYKKYSYNGKIYEDGPAAMTGNPLTLLFDNLYLIDYDYEIVHKCKVYCRYCDDIIMYGTLDQVKDCSVYTQNVFKELKLKFHLSRTGIFNPGEDIEYLRCTLNGSKIDVSYYFIKQVEKVVRKKIYSLLKMKRQYKMSDTFAMKCAYRLIESYYKLFEPYFYKINRTNGLKKIDRIMQDALRTVGSGKFRNGRYSISYSQLKEIGYKTLVDRYYSFDWKKKRS